MITATLAGEAGGLTVLSSLLLLAGFTALLFRVVRRLSVGPSEPPGAPPAVRPRSHRRPDRPPRPPR